MIKTTSPCFRKLKAVALLSSIVFMLSGCVYIIVGGIGALGGYVVSPDTVEGITTSDLGAAWDTSVQIASIMGTVQEQNQEGGIIKADIQNAKVTITISVASEKAVKLTVKARKSFFPKITLAQDVFVKIMSRLKE